MDLTTFFAGLRVLDISTVLAGPSVASFFAELGAEVIKIESPSGDVTRTWFAKGENTQQTSAYYLSVNHDKKVVVMDLKNNRSALDPYLKMADVVIMNFKPGDDQKLQLDSESLRNYHPHLIIAKIKGFEEDNLRVAYDVVLQAETGFMSINGTKESGPLKMPVAMMDVLAAHQLKEAILCALIHRLRTGEGATVSCSLEMAGITGLMNQAMTYVKSGIVAEPMGSLHPNICPYGETLTFGDGVTIVLAVGSQNQFEQLCVLLQIPNFCQDERCKDNPSRVIHRKEILPILQSAAENLDFAIMEAQWIQSHIPFGRIKNMAEVMQSPVGQQSLVPSADGLYVKSVAFTWE
jgi:crotonobetainyl-CoA:carnitine CoA-transferase CaiB-like acyl-CoA transferase